jgi:K+-transporting ATPase ATPase C chain
MLSELRPAILITVVFTIVTGLLYPLAVTGITQAIFPSQASGSLIVMNGRVVGSELIGQSFSKPEYFHGRPSAAGNNGYDATASGGSNLGPTNPALEKRLSEAAAQFRKENPDYKGLIPADAITTSGSGLDPHISPANAMAQVPRVAAARLLKPEQLALLVAQFTGARQLGILGEPRVNVLKLNLELDRQNKLK